MKVMYVSGPYRAPTENGVFENIMRARAAAHKLWEKGWAVVCPHTNSMFMGGLDGRSDEAFIEGDLEIVKRCDAIFMLNGWLLSEGARQENQTADGRLRLYFESEGYPTP